MMWFVAGDGLYSDVETIKHGSLSAGGIETSDGELDYVSQTPHSIILRNVSHCDWTMLDVTLQ